MAIGFPFEHPIDSMKTQWQAKPYLKNEAAVTNTIPSLITFVRYSMTS